ncbi:MAG: SBBP repeat-containing protein, partial [Mycobacterium sp.]|nr:SBBP repeat-containing protein [Mycobacterium sp.]
PVMPQSSLPPRSFVPGPLRHTVAQGSGAPAATAGQTTARTSAAAKLAAGYGALPLSFEPNVGQTAASVSFLTHGDGGTLFLTSQQLVLTIPLSTTQSGQPAVGSDARRGHALASRATPGQQTHALSTTPITAAVVGLQYLHANPHPTLVGLDALPGKVNYFRGKDPSQWHTDVPTYARVAYQNIYPGIDLVLYGNQGHMEYDWTVAPGADPTAIQLAVEGAQGAQIDAHGDLVQQAGGQTVRQGQPTIYQTVRGKRLTIHGNWRSLGGRKVGFTIGAYDHTRPLVIDPVLAYSTYLGGSGSDEGRGIAVDGSGDAYVTGYTSSTDFPTSQDAIQQGYVSSWWGVDAFVTKLNAGGTQLLYSTYLSTSTNNYGGSRIAVDGSGNAFVTGLTGDWTFPTTAGAFQPTWQGGEVNAFVTKLSATGDALLYSTFLSGSSGAIGESVAVGAGDNAYVTGVTSSTDFPLTPNAAQPTYGGGDSDGFVTELNAAGTGLIYSTYLGGSADTVGWSIAVNSSGHAAVTGSTTSTDFPTSSNAVQRSYGGNQDAFVTLLNAEGSQFLYSTYLGGSDFDAGTSVALDGADDAYVAGTTYSADFPTTTGAYQTVAADTDAFVAKLNSTGTRLLYSTFINGMGGGGLAVDATGNAYVVGNTGGGFQTTADAYAPQSAGDYDGVIAKLDATGSALLYGTYLGGSWLDDINDIALDGNGAVYVTGMTQSADFPVTNGGGAPSGGDGAYDTFVTKLSIPAVLPSTQNRCSCNSAQPAAGQSFNSRTGNYFTGMTDLAVASAGPALTWTRTYNSQATGDADQPGLLGYGWADTFSTHLVTHAMPGGEPNTIIVRSAEGNWDRFTDPGSGQFTPFPGVYSTLVQHGDGTYTETAPYQSTRTFSPTGQLTAENDGHGGTLRLAYDAGSRLTQVTDANNAGRYLAIDYYPGTNQLQDVRDPAGRSVHYVYAAAGDLQQVGDVMGRATTYSYTNHLMTAIQDNQGQQLVGTTYDSYAPAGTVIGQVLQAGTTLAVTYTSTDTVVVTTGQDGSTDTVDYQFDPNTNTLIGELHNGTAVQQSQFDQNITPGASVDGNGNTSTMVSNPSGEPVRVTNAMAQTSTIDYDSAGRPIAATDTLGRQTGLTYDAAGNLTQVTTGITTTTPLSLTTHYVYNARYPGKNWLEDEISPSGVDTHYDYDVSGQVSDVTTGYGSSQAETTGYGYDNVGRVITTTVGLNTPLARSDVTRYNADNSIAATVQNYKTGTFNPAHPDQDVTTTYRYSLSQ